MKSLNAKKASPKTSKRLLSAMIVASLAATRQRRGRRDQHREPGSGPALGQHDPRQPGQSCRGPGSRDHQQPELRRRRPQFRSRHGVRAPRPAERVRPHLAGPLRLPRQRRRLVRRGLRGPGQRPPGFVQPPGQRPGGIRPERRDRPLFPRPVRRDSRRLRVRQVRYRRGAGQRQARPPHRVLGRGHAQSGAQPELRPVGTGPGQAVLGAGHRSQGTVPAARSRLVPGPGHARALLRRPVLLRLGAGAHPRGRLVPRLQRPSAARRRVLHLRRQRQ